MGNKTKWRYPLQVNSSILRRSRKVIIVESIGDMLSLWDAGIKNVIVSFGVSISSSLSSLFLMYNMNEIVISLNNDFDNNNIGNIASNKCKSKLLNHFDEHQVKICLPPKNDFGEMTKAEILSWRKTI
jgi:DNA primase